MNIVDKFVLNKTGQVDYVQNGQLYRGGNAPSVMVTAKADLAQLPDIYPPGTVAYTCGFKNMWQLGADGEWAVITEEGN